jgi:hypothetical protein
VLLSTIIWTGEGCWCSFVFLATIPEHQTEKTEDIEGKAKWIDLKELETMDNIFPPSSIILTTF